MADRFNAFRSTLLNQQEPSGPMPAGRKESLVDILMRALHAHVQKAGKNVSTNLEIRRTG